MWISFFFLFSKIVQENCWKSLIHNCVNISTQFNISKMMALSCPTGRLRPNQVSNLGSLVANCFLHFTFQTVRHFNVQFGSWSMNNSSSDLSNYRLWKTVTSSLPSDSWWRCSLPQTTAGSLTTRAAWWVWTSLLCAPFRYRFYRSHSLCCYLAQSNRVALSFRFWSHRRKKQSTSMEEWIRGAPSHLLAPLRLRKRGEHLVLVGLWPMSLQAASNTLSKLVHVWKQTPGVFLLLVLWVFLMNIVPPPRWHCIVSQLLISITQSLSPVWIGTSSSLPSGELLPLWFCECMHTCGTEIFILFAFANRKLLTTGSNIYRLTSTCLMCVEFTQLLPLFPF